MKKIKKAVALLLSLAVVSVSAIPAFATETSVQGTVSTHIQISNIVSQKSYTHEGKTDTVYTVPVGSQITCYKNDGTITSLDYAVFQDLASIDGTTDIGQRVYTSFSVPDSMEGKVIFFWNATDTESVICQISNQKTGNNSSTDTIAPVKNYKIDTGAKLVVKAGKTYQFKITASSKPTFVCGNSSVFKVTYNGSKGNDYFFKVTATGKTGQVTGFYVNGEKTPCTIATITGSAKNYKSDTGAKLTVKSCKTYQFKITASSKPTFACGNGSAFKVKYTGSKGSDYFFKVTATGKVGQAAGFYVNGEKAPCTVATIA